MTQRLLCADVCLCACREGGHPGEMERNFVLNASSGASCKEDSADSGEGTHSILPRNLSSVPEVLKDI